MKFPVLSSIIGTLCCSYKICCALSFPIYVSWQPVENQLTLHEPIIVKLSVKNDSGETADLNLGANFTEGVQVTIVKPDGSIVSAPQLQPSGVSRVGRAHIPPHDTYSHDVVIDQWYDFEATGHYEIRLNLRYPISVGKLGMVSTVEGNVPIVIYPRDEASLARKCVTLVQRVVNPPTVADPGSVDEAWSAVTALTHIHDPIVVPYLVQVQHSPFLWARSIALRALPNFFTTDAVDALISAANGSDDDSVWARSTLLKMARETQNPELRQRIILALGESQR